jgi:hypothetical protein
MAYYVSYSNITAEEPSAGWYYLHQDDDGMETLRGPFPTKDAALDDEGDGAYSAWLDYQREDLENYRQDMIDAGRGHLLRGDE